MDRVRMRDVAVHAGVSVRTVSNVVNGYAHVSTAMRDRVQRSLDELDYKMDYLARGLKSGRTGFIAMVVPYLDEPYFALLAQAVVRAAAGRGLGVLVDITGSDPAAELKTIQDGMASVADGVLVCHPGQLPEARLPSPGFPLVIVGGPRPGPELDYVGTDDAAAARAAVVHLARSGRRRIAMIGASPGDSGRRQHDGYQQALAEADLEPAGTLARPDQEPGAAAGMAEMDRYLDGTAPAPDAVFAASDVVAIGVLRSLAEHGLRVPGDVAVIGVGGIAEAEYITPSLSSIAFDLDAMAGRALDLLEEQTGPGRESRTPRHESTPFRLVARESTGPPASMQLAEA